MAGSTLESIYESSTSELYDLATVLGELAKSIEEGGGGFDVVMLTLSQDGKHLKKNDDPNLKREVEFFEARQKGVRCYLVDNMHHKYVRTPFHFAWGASTEQNGLFGHTLDNLTVVREGEQLYRQTTTSSGDCLILPVLTLIPQSCPHSLFLFRTMFQETQKTSMMMLRFLWMKTLNPSLLRPQGPVICLQWT